MFKILDEVCTPTTGSKYSAGIDLYAREDVVIGAGETVKVPLGVCIDTEALQITILAHYENRDAHIRENIIRLDNFKKSHYIALKPRSSLRAKGIISHSGVVDLDYKDELMMIIHNPLQPYIIKENDVSRGYIKQTSTYTIKKGDKIAQAILMEHKSYLFGIESDDERTGGFGSTGK